MFGILGFIADGPQDRASDNFTCCHTRDSNRERRKIKLKWRKEVSMMEKEKGNKRRGVVTRKEREYTEAEEIRPKKGKLYVHT